MNGKSVQSTTMTEELRLDKIRAIDKDIAVVERVRAGDEQAVTELINTYLQQVFKYSRYVLPPSATKADAEDITQEVFLRFWQNPQSWQPQKCRLIAWLLRVAHNLCVDYIRLNVRYVDKQDSTTNLPLEWEDTHSASALFELEKSNIKETVQQALRYLSIEQRSAVSLCYLRGLKNEEAAEVMGLTLAALQSLLARARRKLVTILGKDPRAIPQQNDVIHNE